MELTYSKNNCKITVTRDEGSRVCFVKVTGSVTKKVKAAAEKLNNTEFEPSWIINHVKKEL